MSEFEQGLTSEAQAGHPIVPPEASSDEPATVEAPPVHPELASEGEVPVEASTEAPATEIADGPGAVPEAGEPVADANEAAPPVRKKKQSAVSSVLSTVQSLSVTVTIAIFVITFVVQAFQIPSESMENTLLIGDYLLVDKVHYGSGNKVWNLFEPYSKIQRGDIIVFRYPVNPTQHFVKRVIGLPGDRIRLVRKKVFVNGKPLNEPYVVYQSPYLNEYRDNFPSPNFIEPDVEPRWWGELRKLMDDRELIVPEGNYFVLGDNRDRSADSRYWGFVPRENIVGRPLVIYFSMRKPIEVTTPLASFTDKLHDLTYNLSDLSGRIRWRRTLRLIK